ncbi:MAG: DUF1990 domain-containing protein [Cyanobacteria bacterium SZAS-4]|nr:DUF1990 domain-containing protein [Cyanobacteria bacterium SZAS-4]
MSDFLLEQSQLGVRYPGIEMTRLGKDHSDPRYRKHFVQTTLGTGEAAFITAVDQIKSWHHLSMDWIELYPPQPPVAPNTTLVVGANHFIMWSVNACRIIYTIDEWSEEKSRFGYAYGTLPSHVEQGEESFILEWDKLSDSVTYQILAYSRPNHRLVALFWPLAILIQDRFRKQSLAVMKTLNDSRG